MFSSGLFTYITRFAILWTICGTALSAGAPAGFFRAIRENDLPALRTLAADPAAVNTPDARGMTPLHAAALLGSAESVEILLAAGADVQARSTMGATPLILGASSPEKVKLLVLAGSDPNAQTKAGITPLMIAADAARSAGSVRILLRAGADLHRASERGTTALLAAAAGGDLETVRLLIRNGAKIEQADKGGFTPLMSACMSNQLERVKLFIARGANVNAANVFAGKVRHGNIALTKMTPLIMASTHGSPAIVRALIAAGADVNAQDGRGITPLMAAVSSDSQNPKVVEALLKAGANPARLDVYGDSALDWARKSGYPDAVRLLEASGAKAKAPAATPAAAETDPKPAYEAVRKAMNLLERSEDEFFKQSGCMGCHHQLIIARARAVAGPEFASGVVSKEEQRSRMMSLQAAEPALLQFIDPGGEVDSVAAALLGFAAEGIPASSLTDAAVNYIAGKQKSDGSWTVFGVSRAPVEESTITRTGIALRALELYGWPARKAEFEERVARARAWLRKARARTTYERIDLLAGLHWAGASAPELETVAKQLLTEQRLDGGWGQNLYLASDAYATGAALHALREAGFLCAADPAYRRGTEFLLRTQLDDGSWYVRSRAPKFQPYFESGFPHAHDQWISAAATAYAVMALAPAASSGESAALR